MSTKYFKRYRMELDLRRTAFPEVDVPSHYRLVPWRSDLIEAHADAKYRSFRWEIDATVFPCLGEFEGCLQLMHDIRDREGFLPDATWLVQYVPPTGGVENCGTIQGIRSRHRLGGIQNVGITPEHRSRGLGMNLVRYAVEGFRMAGVVRVFLEVTAENHGAVRLYRRLGFRHVRTVYKSVEIAYT